MGKERSSLPSAENTSTRFIPFSVRSISFIIQFYISRKGGLSADANEMQQLTKHAINEVLNMYLLVLMVLFIFVFLLYPNSAEIF